MTLAVVIPAFNESSTIGEVVRELAGVAPEAEVVVVDDGSFDDTGARAEGAGAIVLRHVVNRGQGAALETGTRYAVAQGADIVVHFDADGQHRAEDIFALVAPIVCGEAEVVFGSRFLSSVIPSLSADRQAKSPPEAGAPLAQRDLSTSLTSFASVEMTKGLPFSKRFLLIPLARLVNRVVAGVWLSDAHNGLRALSRNAAQKIVITQDRMAHNTEIPAQVRQAGFTFVEVPVSIRYREYGQGVGGGVAILKDLALGRFL